MHTANSKSTKTCIQEMQKDKENLKPVVLKKNNFATLYYKYDRSFLISKTDMFVKFIFNKEVNSAKYATFLRLMIYAMQHHFRNYFHQEKIRMNIIHLNASPK